jgi:hypothetical protein
MSDYCNPSDTEDLLNWSIAYPVVQSKSTTNTLDLSDLNNDEEPKSIIKIDSDISKQTKSSDNKMYTYLERNLKRKQDLSFKTKSSKSINKVESKNVNSFKVRNII